jgi:hypothetical protein
MAYSNRVRLPLQLHSPQFPEERRVFRKANGQAKTLSVVIRKVYELETDYMPESWHQKLKIALAHDVVTVEGEKYLGEISQDGDYAIEWPEGVLHYPAAKANVKVQATPFDATNSNCQTCEEVSQLSLEDDEATGIYGALQEDEDYEVNTAENDSICCAPAVFSLVSFNSDYLDSCTIDPSTGVVSMHTGTGLTSANGILLATYRVTCPDGSYDEADITADIEGSVEGCLAPFITLTNGYAPTEASVEWDEPVPGGTYYWELYEGSSPVGSPVQTGTVTDDELILTGLTPDTLYYFQIRTVCAEATFSNYVSAQFSTLPASGEESCGMYRLRYERPFFEGFINVEFTNCSGDIESTSVINNIPKIICALQNSPGDPVYISSSPFLTIEYIELC